MEKVQNLFLLKRCDSMDGILPLLKTDVRYAGDAWIFEGVCASQRGQKEQAYKAFVQARRANPRSAEACFNIAKYKAGLNDLKTAVSYLDTAIAINANYAQAFFDRGNVYGNLGQFDRALADYQRYLELRPDDPIGIFYRGQAYCLTNQKQLGCADLVRADQLGVAEAKSKIAVFCNGKR
jgi:tetratricopeptide (TPR) repeat protein